MKTCRVHITGASGAGVTSLGRALADALSISHHDTDDYFWRPTNPPYLEIREVADRVRLMKEMFLDRSDWVLSGSLDGWGDPIIPSLDSVVFLYVPTADSSASVCARARRGGSAPMLLLPAARGISRRKNSSSGRRTTMTALVRAAISRGMRRGSRRCRVVVLRLDGCRPLEDLVKEVCRTIQ